jgi:hypothetical protein
MINQERWFSLSLCEKMGHIGSEITRARIWNDKKDQMSSARSLERALDLIDLTKNDPSLKNRLREVCYLKEIVADKYIQGETFSISLESVEKYCTEFALVARKRF